MGRRTVVAMGGALCHGGETPCRLSASRREDRPGVSAKEHELESVAIAENQIKDDQQKRKDLEEPGKLM